MNSLLDRREDHVRRQVSSFDDDRIDRMIDQCRERRQVLRRTQVDIAHEINCTKRTIIYLENHQQMPSLSLFVRYAAACGFTLTLTKSL